MTVEPGDEAAERRTPDSPGVTGGGAGSGQALCRVELFGLARSIVGRRAIDLDLPRGATVADALARLAVAYPALVGPVIRPDGRGLAEGHLLNLSGRAFVEDVSTAVGPGDTILILSNTAGG